jgi:hypothetical protein
MIVYTYQWQRCDASGDNCVDISGEVDSTYIPVQDDVGNTLRAKITATNEFGSEIAYSDVTDVIVEEGTNPPPTPAVNMGGIGIQRLGDSYFISGGYDRFDRMTITSSYAQLAAALDPGPEKIMPYVAGPDVNMYYDYGMPVDVAIANDWLLKNSSGTPYRNSGYPSNYVGDVGDPDYAVYFADHVGDMAIAKGCNGVYIDDILGDTQGFIGGYPFKYPTKSQWMEAMRSFCEIVGPELQSRNLYVMVNASNFTAGSAGSNTSADDMTWWNMIGPYFNALQKEYWLQEPNNVHALYPDNPSQGWNGQWASYMNLIDTAHAHGCDFYAIVYGSITRVPRYVRGSMLLRWNGAGDTTIFQPVVDGDPWSSDWTVNIGTPVEAASVSGGVWKRTHTDGIVYVNPTTGTLSRDSVSVPALDAVFVET